MEDNMGKCALASNGHAAGMLPDLTADQIVGLGELRSSAFSAVNDNRGERREHPRGGRRGPS
jgi:hypothetical protein